MSLVPCFVEMPHKHGSCQNYPKSEQGFQTPGFQSLNPTPQLTKHEYPLLYLGVGHKGALKRFTHIAQVQARLNFFKIISGVMIDRPIFFVMVGFLAS